MRQNAKPENLLESGHCHEAGPTEKSRQTTFQGLRSGTKAFLKIGEVAQIVGVKTHVLRYWEKEFASIAPTKTASNHRLYRRVDVERLLEIKHLLYEQGLTIQGAKKRLAPRRREAFDLEALRTTFREAKVLLQELLAHVGSD